MINILKFIMYMQIICKTYVNSGRKTFEKMKERKCWKLNAQKEEEYTFDRFPQWNTAVGLRRNQHN